MKTLPVIFILCTISLCSTAQTILKEHKAGHTFTVALPDYLNKTTGLNNASAIQYKNEVKDIYGFIIFDTKEELALADLNYSSIREFYDDFIKDFATDEETRKVSEPLSKSKDSINYIESDLTYHSKDADIDIYYLVGIVETKKSFYKVLSWTAAENKDKFKADFQKIIYSLKD